MPKTIGEFIAFSDELGRILDGIPGVTVVERRFGWCAERSLATFTDYRIDIEVSRSARHLWRARPASSLREISRVLDCACGLKPELIQPHSLYYQLDSDTPVAAREREFGSLTQAFGVSLLSAPPLMGGMSFHRPDSSPDELVEYFFRLQSEVRQVSTE